MSLTALDRLVIERWVGPVADTDETRLGTMITSLGGPEVAALQELMRRRAAMVVSPTTVESGTDRVDHSKNLKALDDLIDELVSYIKDNLDDLDINDDGLGLVAAAGTGSTKETILVRTFAANRRRG